MPRIINNKDYQLLQALKGFYGSTAGSDNQQNEYLRRLASAVTGLRLPDISKLTRDQIQRAYETVGPVNGIVNYIASATGEMFKFLELRQLQPDGTYKDIDKHWICDLLEKPNDRFNTKRFGQAWAVNRCLYDDAFVYAPIKPGKDRRIPEMYVMSGQKVVQDGGGLDVPFKGIRYAGREGTIPFRDRIFESFGYNLDDTSIFGTSKIVAAAVYLSIMEKGMRRQDVSLDNGGVAGLVTPKGDQYGINPADADDLTKEFNDISNINKIKTLRMAVDYHPIGTTPVDLNILGSHKEAVTVLCFLFNLPVDLYYGQSKYENAKEAKKAIYQLSAIPLAEEFGADLISYAGLDKEGYELVVNTDRIPVLEEDATAVLDRVTKMHGTLNELRTANGYERIEKDYADKPMIPMGVMFGDETYDINEING